MAGRVGFWSYVYADDVADGGRIRRLASDLREQYALISGEPVDIFVDHDAIAWGDNWREQIDSSLASILFFVPVITPRYFLSAECRRELQEFARGAERLGLRELVIPLLYVDVPALQEESPKDEALALVTTYQWVDWRELRFADVTSGAYRRAVGGLAQRLFDANQRVLLEEPPSPGRSDVLGTLTPSKSPGTLDVLAAGEEALPRLTETLGAIGSEIEKVGNLAEQATEDIQRGDHQSKGLAVRLAVSRRLAYDLSPHAERILELANNYTASLYEVDGAMRTIITQTPAEISDNPIMRAVWDEFSAVIITLAGISMESTASIRAFVGNLSQTESISRDLRLPIQKLRRGLTILTEGAAVINEWKRLVDESTIE